MTAATTALPPTATVYERMSRILAELPPIGKDQKNAQQGFMFRGHDDVLNALNPLLAKHGVFILPSVLERISEQRTTAKGGVMFEVNLRVEFTFYGAAGDWVAASTWGEGTDMGDKSTNKAMTMAFKNVMNQAFAISSKEPADADAETPEHSSGRAEKPAFVAPAPKRPTVQALEAFAAKAAEYKKAAPDFDVDGALQSCEGKDARLADARDGVLEREHRRRKGRSLMCACEPSFTCSRCAADDARWLAIEYGDVEPSRGRASWSRSGTV